MEFGASAEDIGPHLPRAPDAARGGEGSGDGGRQTRHSYVILSPENIFRGE